MKQLVVTAGVIIQNDQVLMAQRRLGDREGGKWEFPGGKVEWGEDPRDGLQRELQEELGIKVEVGRVLDVVSEVSGELQLFLIYFACKIREGVPTAIECQQVAWFNQDEGSLLPKPPADERFWNLNLCF